MPTQCCRTGLNEYGNEQGNDMGFGQGLSGLNAAAQTLDIIGNNIANSGTVGFKASTATFADVYASSKVGLGVQVASVNQRFTIGTVTGTGPVPFAGTQWQHRVQPQRPVFC